MIYAGLGVYLQESRLTLAAGDARMALAMIREALKEMAEMAEDVPHAWTGGGKGIKADLGHSIKKLATKAKGAIGIKGHARHDAEKAYQQGQAALKSTKKIAKDADNLAKKGDSDGAVAAHNQGVKTHQAAIASLKKTMDTANKEGDKETADWAAHAGAVHTNNRGYHMKAGSGIRQWATKKKASDDSERVRQNVAKTAQQHTAQKGAQAKSASDMYKDHMAKVAAGKPAAAPAAKPAAPASGVAASVKKPAARRPGAAKIPKHASDTSGATRIRASS